MCVALGGKTSEVEDENNCCSEQGLEYQGAGGPQVTINQRGQERHRQPSVECHVTILQRCLSRKKPSLEESHLRCPQGPP